MTDSKEADSTLKSPAQATTDAKDDRRSETPIEDDYDYDINEDVEEEEDLDDDKLFNSKNTAKSKTPASNTSSSESEAEEEVDDEENSNIESKTPKTEQKTSETPANANPPIAEVTQTPEAAAMELEASQALEEKNKALTQLLNNINYAVVLAFLEKFSIHLAIKEYTFKTLECQLTNAKTLNRKLVDFHLKLIKNLPMGKHAKKDKWEYYLAKFARRFSASDAALIENGTYLTCDVSVIVMCLKNLLESQFDENQKFKQILLEQITDSNFLREQPLGRDKDGFYYMIYMDKEYSVRLFSYDSTVVDAAKTWKIVASELEALREFVGTLDAEPALEKLRKSKRYMQNLARTEKIKREKQKELDAANGVISEEKTESKEETKVELAEETAVKKELEKEAVEEVKEESAEEVKKEYSEEVKAEPEGEVKKESAEEVVKEESAENVKEEAEEEANTSLKKEAKKKEPAEKMEEDAAEFGTPIALRKSTRSSARNRQEIAKTPPVTPQKKAAAQVATPAKQALVFKIF